MKFSSPINPFGIALILAVVAGSIVLSNATLTGQVSTDPQKIYIDNDNTEKDIPANTHVGLYYEEGNTFSIDRGEGLQGAGEWLVYEYDGSEPPFKEANYFYSPALQQKFPGNHTLATMHPGAQYYVLTDIPLVFSPLTGFRLKAVCGNGTVEEGESCDGVNGCNTECHAKIGYWCTAETNSCRVLIPILGLKDTLEDTQEVVTSVCGNGDPTKRGEDAEEGEECDDGNLISGDGCSGSDHPNGGCTIEFCGDGYHDADGILASNNPNETERIWKEECDDGGYCFKEGVAPWPENAMKDTNGNPIRCTTMGWPDQTECGEGAECTVASFDGCASDCVLEYCGDGVLQPKGKDGILGTADDEQCDSTDQCSDTCKKEEEGVSSSATSSLQSSVAVSSAATVTCDSSGKLDVLFDVEPSAYLSVPTNFAIRVGLEETTAGDDINCDGTVDGVPTESGIPPTGDFNLVVDRYIQLIEP